jgi:hypothetical protein
MSSYHSIEFNHKIHTDTVHFFSICVTGLTALCKMMVYYKFEQRTPSIRTWYSPQCNAISYSFFLLFLSSSTCWRQPGTT